MKFDEALATIDAVIFAKTGKHLSDAQRAVLQGTWSRRKYREIAAEYRCTPEYLKQDVGPKLWRLLSEELGERVSKTNFRSVVERRWQSSDLPVIASESTYPVPNHLEGEKYTSTALLQQTPIDQPIATRIDWGEATDTALFFGRSEELTLLKQWVLKERCQVVALLGMGGIGKTSISIEFTQHVQDQFECVIWRSLRNAPPLSELLAEIVQFLSNDAEIHLPPDIYRQISQLVDQLKAARCLVVLDNVESILQEQDRVGRYIPGCEDYGELFKRLGETRHQSALVITSREKPKEIAALEGKHLKVRSFPMGGLPAEDCQTLIQVKGISGTPQQWQCLIDKYAGNPLALKIVTTTVEDLFDGDLSEFLDQIQHGTAIFGDIRDLLEQQLGRLSEFEQEIMYWLAINREAVSLGEIRRDILSTVSPAELIESLESLRRRSLIEKNSNGFTQQPVVMEYMVENFIETIAQEIQTEQLTTLNRYAIIKSQAKDYIRESQMRVILQPVSYRLLNQYPLQGELEIKFKHLLNQLRTPNRSGNLGYAGGNLINLCQELNLDLADYDFSNLAIWQAYLQDANLQGVNFAGADLSRTIFAKTLGNSLEVALGPNDKLATGDADGKILLWSVEDGQQLLVCQGKTEQVHCLAFSPDGTLLASGSEDRTVRLWQVDTGECLHRGQHHQDAVSCIGFCPQGRLLASGSFDQIICLWEVKSGALIQTLQGHTEAICTVAFSADGNFLMSSDEGQTVCLWHVSTGKCLSEFTGDNSLNWTVTFIERDINQTPTNLTFGPTESNLAARTTQLAIASSCDENMIRLWDVERGQCFQTLQGHRDSVWQVVFSSDSQMIASSSDDQTVRIWQTTTGECLKTLVGFEGQICSLAFDPSNQILATGSQDQTVQLWEVSTGQRLRTLRGHRHQVWSFVLSPDGQFLASGSDDQQVRLWDIETGRCVKRFRGHSEWVWVVDFSPRGDLLASGSYDHTIKLWNVSTGECLKTFHGHSDRIEAVSFSPDGTLLVSASIDQTARLWDIQTGECCHLLQGHVGGVESAAFNHNGQYLATGSSDQTIRLWQVETGNCIKTLVGHRQRIQTLAFHPTGQALASGSLDRTVCLWCLKTGECLKNWSLSIEHLLGIAFTSEGKLRIGGIMQGTVYLWDFETQLSIKSLSGDFSPASLAHFSLDRQTIAIGSPDQPIQIWHLVTGNCIRILRTDKPYDGMNITEVTGITPAQKVTLKALGAVDLNHQN